MNNSSAEAEKLINWEKDKWFAMIIFLVFLGALGQILLIWIIKAHKTMSLQINIFIFNMAVSDLMVLIFSIPFGMHSYIYADWIFGSYLCTFNEIVVTIGVCVYVLSLTMISMERHYTILPPPNALDIKLMTMSTLGIWISSFILSAPNWIFATLVTNKYTKKVRCTQLWPDAEIGNSLSEIYAVFFTLATYVLPLAYMTYRYGRLSLNIWGPYPICISPEQRRSVKVMIVVTAVYGLSSLPFRFCILFEDFCKNFTVAPSHQIDITKGVFWLALTNSWHNPIILCSMDKKFRLGFKKAFRWVPFVKYDAKNILEGTYDEEVRCDRFKTITES